MAKSDKKYIHEGHRDRLRNKALEYDEDTLEEHEILELMLSFVIPYKDTNPLAHDLIDTFGSLYDVINADTADLMKVKGVGDKTAKFLALQKLFMRSINKSSCGKDVTITNTKQAVDYCKTLFDDMSIEKLYLICLNQANKVIYTKLINSGDYNKVSIDIKKLTKLTLAHNSYRIILCHNHPDGKCSPSFEDNKFTRAILINMFVNDIHLVDHIIIGNNEDYYSYHTSGQISEYLEDAKKFVNDI